MMVYIDGHVVKDLKHFLLDFLSCLAAGDFRKHCGQRRNKNQSSHTVMFLHVLKS